jgi:hypothetical protein
MEKEKRKLIVTIGYIILFTSFLMFGLILVVPWFDFSGKQIAGITTILIIAGEILFYLSIFILGRSFYNKIKNRLMFWKAKPSGSDLPEQNTQV